MALHFQRNVPIFRKHVSTFINIITKEDYLTAAQHFRKLSRQHIYYRVEWPKKNKSRYHYRICLNEQKVCSLGGCARSIACARNSACARNPKHCGAWGCALLITCVALVGAPRASVMQKIVHQHHVNNMMNHTLNHHQ